MENLLATFGFENFLTGQEEVVREIVYGTNRKVIVNMKSLGGKTSAFQMAGSVNKNGKALVICSSLALIEQQVNYLNSLNLRAVTITHNVVDHERSILMNELRSRESNIKFLYVTPEMIEKSNTVPPLIRDLCESGSFSFVVIDDGLRLEGYRDDRFRENVVYLRALRERNVKLKWIVMTTSSEAEINQIKQEFGFEDAVVIQSASFDRADIFLGVRVINMVRENLIAVFLHDVREALGAGNQPGSGLIYTKYSQDVTLLTKLLGEIGIDAKPFNGKGDGLRNFNDWLSGFFPVLVATSESLRYGIVKRPLAFVFHYHPSKALKDYYQESGRANNPNGVAISRIFVKSDYTDVEADPSYHMLGYLQNWQCRHQHIARVVFGENIRPCTNFCDNCIA